MSVIVQHSAPSRPADVPMWIAGQPQHTDAHFPLYNPYTGEVLAHAPIATVEDVKRAIELMTRRPVPKLTRHERATILRRIAAALEREADAFAQLITSESGLCRKDTQLEVLRAVTVLNVAADATSFDDSAVFPGDVGAAGKRRRIFTQRDTVGLVAAITPFNHPLNQVVHKLAPAIATSTPIIIKPSEKTPLSAFRLAQLTYEAGLPPEMLSVVTGVAQDIGPILATHPDVALLTFTGSVAVGKRLAQQAGYRRIVLELGGNDPLIVMEDADLSAAATIAVAGAFGNSGQRCTSVKRLLVQQNVADEFVELLRAKTEQLVCGAPGDARTDVGTVIDEAAAVQIERRIDAALAAGAHLVSGHRRVGAQIHPTVLDQVPRDCELVAEETFGPVAPIIRIRDIDDAIAVSNSTDFGLSSGVCTNRLDWITRFVEELNVGSVNIGDAPGFRSEASPFGGVKDSGLGHKEGVIECMKLYTTVKTFSLPWPN